MTEGHLVSPERQRQIGALARALLTAVRSWSLYPPDHPAVTQAVDRLQTAVQAATAPSGLALGVTPDALLVGDTSVSEGPFSEVAALLHHRDILQLAFAPQVPREALRALLDLLAIDDAARREAGGPAAWWAVHGHPAVAIDQIDYARVLEERPVAHAARRDALWQSLVRGILERRLTFDEAAQRRLLDLAGDPAAIAAFAADLMAPQCTPEGAPLLASQAAAVLAAYRHLLDIVAVLDPDRLDEVTRHLAAATSRLDPRVVLQMLCTEEEHAAAPGGRPRVLERIAGALDEDGAARLLATTLAIEGRPSDRLATVVETLAPDPPRRRRVLTLTRSLLAAGDFAQPSEQIEGLRAAMDELLLKANEQPFVSTDYRQTLDTAADRVATLGGRELPPELPEWLATLGQENVRELSTILLVDLLHLEVDAARAAELVADMRHLAEDLLLAGDYALARRVIAPLAETADTAQALARDACRAALETLATSAAYRDAAALLGEMGDEEFARFAAVTQALGASTVTVLREALATEKPTLAVRRAGDLMVAFGPAAVAPLAPLAEDGRWYVQRHAAVVLARIAAPAAVPLLQRLLRAADPRVVREAVRALCRIDDPQAVRAVHTALRATRGDARRQLVEALIAQEDVRVVPVLGRILDESDAFGRDYTVVIDATAALARLRADQAVPPLVRLMYRRHWWARRRARQLKQAAVAALSEIGSARALAALEEASRRGDRVLRKIAATARRAGDPTQ